MSTAGESGACASRGEDGNGDATSSTVTRDVNQSAYCLIPRRCRNVGKLRRDLRHVYCMSWWGNIREHWALQNILSALV